MFTGREMTSASGPSAPIEPPERTGRLARRMASRAATALGLGFRDERLKRSLTVRQVADATGLSPEAIYAAESGRVARLETYARLAVALGLRLDATMTEPRRLRSRTTDDLVHAAMGELEAGHFRRLGATVRLDEPYQHDQFAGRADLVAWTLDPPELLHIENKSQIRDVQDTLGSFNAKRAYLGQEIAGRLGIRRWRSETHVLVLAWTAEVLHTLRLRAETFRSIAPDPPGAFGAWWSGGAPSPQVSTTLVVLDPLATARQRLWIGLEQSVAARPRYRGYADLAAALDRASR